MSFAAKDYGEQLLLLHGMLWMQWWFVDSLDILGDVSIEIIYDRCVHISDLLHVTCCYSVGAINVNSDLFGKRTTRNIARDVHCSGTEQRLIDCSQSSIPISSGMTYERYPSAGVICQGNTSVLTECEHGDVRLVDGQKMSKGRVEICADGHWASICNTNWGLVETEIVCKQRGLPVSGEQTDKTRQLIQK